MIDNTTLETINYVKTIDIEFNMKIILIFLFAIYALVSYYYDKKILSNDPRASFKLMTLGARVYYLAYLIFLPTFIYQLPLTEDMGFLLIFQTYLYSILAFYAILVLAIYLLERIFKDWLGWEITMDGLKINMKKLV